MSKQIKVGDVFSTNLYGRGRCVVVKVHEKEIPGNVKIFSIGSGGLQQATSDNEYDLISLDGQAMIKRLPHCILENNWEDCEYSIDELEIQGIKGLLEYNQAEKQKAKEQADADFEREKEALKAEWGGKLNVLDNVYSAKETNKNIRKYLKIMFPNVKCSVRALSGGSVRINVKSDEKGIVREIENAVTKAFGTAYFDGMQDMKVTYRNAFAEIFGKVDYVIVQRDN